MQWQLCSANAAEPVQTRVIDCWPDGSARWMLVDARVTTTGENQAEFFLESGPSTQSSAAPAVEISNNEIR
jgi:hypothetical protein